ncbi:site-specific integrase [Clostridium sp. HBUAS56010]|uniref:site-specific integrase n=1 Tax=Clostridium sp. HBUAS56010 TaxID=2571127 RepID=UPI001177E025|nr:site-specific integrase [Clostridium sp. HBUAS56010]
MLFYEYFKSWVEAYKSGTVAEVTLSKYRMTYMRLKELAPTLDLEVIGRREYQQLINDYALTHEKQTVMDFHRQLKACLLDAYDEKLIERDPTRKVAIRGKMPAEKKMKYLNRDELEKLLNVLPLHTDRVGFDWLILLLAKTGLRFAEGLALTPNDFDFANKKIRVNKTWNYKSANGRFMPTKNQSSVREVTIDSGLTEQFGQLIKGFPADEPFFFDKADRVFNSTLNNYSERYCKEAGVPVISAHCLRHTHASVLLAAGVSIPSVSKRLGHSNVTTTQDTYIHIIRELEEKDKNKAMDCMSSLCG